MYTAPTAPPGSERLGYDFESSRADWVLLDTVPGLISAGEISSATTLAALLYTIVQDAPGNR
jgi:hypothetical protein